MRQPDIRRVRRPRRPPVRTLLRILGLGGVLLLSGAAPALGQVDYTGVPPTVNPPDVYVVDTYVGTPASNSPGVVTLVSAGIRPPAMITPTGSPGTLSVADAAAADPPVNEGDRRLVTGWDLVTVAGLGVTALAAFAVSGLRFRST